MAMEGNATAEFHDSIKELLANKKFNEVLLELRKPSIIERWSNDALDLIADIGACLLDDNGPSTKTADFCLDAFQVLAKVGNCKELLMGFLEQLECLKSDVVRFQVLLPAIQTTLLRVPQKRCQSLNWVLNSLYDSIQNLPVPGSYGFEGKERLLLDFDPDVVKISDALECIIDFLKPFVKDASLWASNQGNQDRLRRQRHILAHFILKLFGVPLAFTDLNQMASASTSKSTMRSLAESLVGNLCELESNFYRLHTFISESNNKDISEDDKENKNGISNLSLATFSYLIHAEEVHKDHLPCVYSHKYTFEVNLPLMCCLLSQSKDCAVHKGLLLSHYLLQYVAVQDLSDKVLDLEECVTFALHLIKVMTSDMWENMAEFRKMAMSIFFKYIEKFNYLGRYKIIFRLFSCSKHAGVQGLLIKIFKSNIIEALQHMPPLPQFVSPGLEKFLRLVLVLHQGVETDLLEECDRILNALSFVRFLLIRDEPNANLTGIWTLVEFVEESFLKPLQIALDLTRAHYEMELNNLKENDISEKAQFSVSGQDWTDQKRSILLSSITGLDVIQSVLSRIHEIISAKKQ